MKNSPNIYSSEGQTMQSAGDSEVLLEFSRTLELVSARAIELAGLDGRTAQQIRQGDYERAKREIAASPCA